MNLKCKFVRPKEHTRIHKAVEKGDTKTDYIFLFMSDLDLGNLQGCMGCVALWLCKVKMLYYPPPPNPPTPLQKKWGYQADG